MDTVTRRRSRMHRQKQPGRLELTERDVAIFRLLSQYRFLRSTFIEAFVGGNSTVLRWRLRDLFDAGYVQRPSQQWQFANARHIPIIYELDAKGRDLLRELGLTSGERSPRGGGNLMHRVMISEIVASIDLSVRTAPSLAFISQEEILERTQNTLSERAPSPLSFPLPGGGYIVPDAIFGIRSPRGVVLYALEADRENEPIRRAGSGSSYASKIARYDALIGESHYKAHLQTSAPLVVLHVTTSERRTLNLTRLAARRPFHLFKTLPDANSLGQLTVPSRRLVEELWSREGLPAYSIGG